MEEQEKNYQYLKAKFEALDSKIKKEEAILSDMIMKAILSHSPQKCEYCGCYDGIHRSNCYFIKKFC